jgi:hypothetical protein
MGPITLFDKSFLQSLSVDESVWFDHFFLANVCPLFYVETLADLEKGVREGRTPEQEVGIIARKFPEMSGAPCVYHGTLAIGDCWVTACPSVKFHSPAAAMLRLRASGALSSKGHLRRWHFRADPRDHRSSRGGQPS